MVEYGLLLLLTLIHAKVIYHPIGQQFSCNWLIDVCTKDPTCKQLHDDWEEKCMTLINWTILSNEPPICTDECRKVNDDFKKHKIWRRSVDCNCGNFNDNIELRDIRETEKCLRRRHNLAVFCGKNMLVECPKGEYTWIPCLVLVFMNIRSL